jgi:Nuclease-related domain
VAAAVLRRVGRETASAAEAALDADPTDPEERIRAGIAGEQLAAVELGRALDDDWTPLHGYRNRRGEIDHLLLGPRGLFAIEVKNINATVHIDGDRWRAAVPVKVADGKHPLTVPAAAPDRRGW